MRGAVGVLSIASVLVIACKTDQPAKPPPTRPEPAPAAAQPKADLPTAPATTQPPSRVFDLAYLHEVEPKLAAPLRPLKVMANRALAHQSWCLPGDDAAAMGRVIEDALIGAGWTELSTRGSAVRAGISARHGELRVSITIGGRDRTCGGRIATAQYAGAEITMPPLEDGERIH